MASLPDVIEVGGWAVISLTITNDAGTATDPATISLTITLPDATTVTKTITDFTHDSTGHYHVDYQTSQAGRHMWHAVTTTPNDVFDGGFDVVASPETAGLLVDPTDYQRVTGDTTTAWANISLTLTDAVTLVEEHLNRKLAYGSHTERLYVYRDGKVYPTNTPLASVTSPAVNTNAIQGAGVYLGTFIPTPAIVNVGDWQAAVPPQADVTYMGGYQPYGTTNGVTPQLPMKVMRAICRVAWLMLHPVALQGVPAGAKSASVGDVSVTGDLSAFVVADPSIERDLRAYRKRKVHAWQRA